jgi:hydroxyacylglutathione hydrolase
MHIHPIPCVFGIAFLIESSRGLFLVDSGSPGQEERVINKMHELGRRDLKLIWITHAHYDHYGSAEALRRLTGALIGVHPEDADSMAKGKSPLGTCRGRGNFYPPLQKVFGNIRPLPKTNPDFTLGDGESLVEYGLNASILHTPGHTPGHTCLILQNGVVFSGDLFGNFPRLSLQCLLATDWNQLPDSLARLQSTQASRIYLGHSKRPISRERLVKVNP